MTPEKISEFMLQRWFCEAQSYAQELKRYRPLARIQLFIDLRKQGKLSKQMDDVRKAVVRDWFRFVLWYIRLRKASKAEGSGVHYPESLLEVHLRH